MKNKIGWLLLYFIIRSDLSKVKKQNKKTTEYFGRIVLYKLYQQTEL